MKDNLYLTFPSLLSQSFKKFPDNNALAFVEENPVTYKEVEEQIASLISFLEELDVKPGDKVALLSTNMPNWGITYFAITFMGAVVVPILPDFLPSEVENIITHSESKIIFVSEGLLPKISNINNDVLQTVVKLEDFKILKPDNQDVRYDSDKKSDKTYTVEEDDLAVIIYTSGTTGKSKGVMLSHKNISSNVLAGTNLQEVNENDRFLSLLPLSHTLENTVGLVIPLTQGSCVYYLRKPPVPAVLLPALKTVKPTMILAVPLIIEKIYRNKILPSFNNKKILRSIYKIPFARKKLNAIAGKKLMKTFGGELKFFGVGGAKLDLAVEKFLIEAKFPYAIGYGLTESSPLLAGTNPQKYVLGSTGKAVQGVTIKINDPDKKTGEGEVWAKGPNIMLGYYKEPGLTKEVITEDGWLKTGDLGMLDKDNNLYIKGRLKNMIVGSSGENIYPEEIESVINNFRHVVESLVIQKKGQLVAMVHFNHEELEQRYQHLRDEITNYVEHIQDELTVELKTYINARVNKFSQVQAVVNQVDPFKKTATKKIKRFLYL